MYFLLILFFGSLLSITFMIGRKLIILRGGQVAHESEAILNTLYLEEWKQAAVKSIRKYSYFGLVSVIRFYFRFSNLLKNKYQELKIKAKSMRGKKSNGEKTEPREASKFLKMISEYKYKIRRIKRQIKEEEDLE